MSATAKAKSITNFSLTVLLLLLVKRLNSNDVLLWIVGSGCSTSVDGIHFLSRKHVNGVFHRAHGMANCTAGTISLNNLRESVIALKLNCLIA
jgi:hypothetical protein